MLSKGDHPWRTQDPSQIAGSVMKNIQRLMRVLESKHYPGVRPCDSSTVSAPLHPAGGAAAALAPEAAPARRPADTRASSASALAAAAAASRFRRLDDVVEAHVYFVHHFHAASLASGYTERSGGIWMISQRYER